MKDIKVKIAQGWVEGTEEENCVVFKGIPYAKPPVGNLRFKRPQRVENWEGVLKATHFGNRCAQEDLEDSFYHKEFYEDEGYKTSISEDGLYLNIWAPKTDNNTLLPVAFYIHGGAFMGGCGHEIEFRTDAFAKNGVILVTINYRLGIFGFLSHPWLQKEDAFACGNYGLLDQIAALDWVRENIEAFGGDKNNITIFGQSAGCMSVQALLAVECARGKFSKAILQSGAGYPTVIQKEMVFEDCLALGEKAADAAGASTLEELRNVSVDVLYDVQKKVIGLNMEAGKGLPFAPVANGMIRTQTYNELIENGLLTDVPMMIGSNKNDITVTPEEAEQCRSSLQDGCRRWALQMEKNECSPVFVYYFKRDLPGDNAGAFHSAELWYVFGTLSQCWRPMESGDYQLSEEMNQYWCNFMKNGNPNGDSVKKWTKYTKDNPFEMIFDIN